MSITVLLFLGVVFKGKMSENIYVSFVFAFTSVNTRNSFLIHFYLNVLLKKVRKYYSFIKKMSL